MRQAQREVKTMERTDQEEIEASGDAIVIAGAIEYGLGLIASAIRDLAKGMNGEEVIEDEQSETYLDGTRK